ncbi:MAG: peroxiredoxin [Parcubacteria group bacterium]|nr:peroxiredoxin [Parcubacteria group bacterium]
MNIKVGQKIPDIAGESQTGTKISLADFLGKKKVVLYFYPKDNTPGCIREGIDFTKKKRSFSALNAVVVGVSVDSLTSHRRFARQHKLDIPLLSDGDKKICADFGILRDSGAAKRTTFVIDKSGKVRHIFEEVNADGHADEVLKKIKEL